MYLRYTYRPGGAPAMQESGQRELAEQATDLMTEPEPARFLLW